MRHVLAVMVASLAGCAAPAGPSGNWDLGGGIAMTPDGQIVVSGRIQTVPTWMLAPTAHAADAGSHVVLTSTKRRR